VCGVDRGLRAFVTRAADQLGALAKGGRMRRLHLRGAEGWISALESLGFEVRAESMSDGTPFANVCISAQKTRRPAV
jgi:hypothetical protein